MIRHVFKICVIVLLTHSTVFAATHEFRQAVDMRAKEEAVVRAVNAYRVQHGLKPLKMMPFIASEARGHSQAMARKSVPFGHQNFMTRIRHINGNLKQSRGGAENVAWFPPSKNPEEVVKLWLTSRGHRHNIEGSFDLTGVGIVQDQRGWFYYTQIFIRV